MDVILEIFVICRLYCNSPAEGDNKIRCFLINRSDYTVSHMACGVNQIFKTCFANFIWSKIFFASMKVYTVQFAF